MKQKVLALVLAAILLVIGLCGCAKQPNLQLDDSEGELYQYTMPAKGDKIAIIHTSLGDITVRFFAEQAPKAVENFLTHAENGYYNGLTFYRVINEFMIQSGSPENTVTGGESIYGEPFENECSPMLHHLHGALAMANGGTEKSNNSQWFIVQNKVLSSTYYSSLTETHRSDKSYGYTEKVVNAYRQDGGAPWCDGKYTVFGQVIEGLDVVDRIGRMKTDKNDRPIEDIVISSIEVTTWQGAE